MPVFGREAHFPAVTVVPTVEEGNALGNVDADAAGAQPVGLDNASEEDIAVLEKKFNAMKEYFKRF